MREGFTLELGTGAAFTLFSEDKTNLSNTVTTRTVPYVAISPLSLSLGGFFTHDLAGMFRIASSSFFSDGNYIVNAFLGPAVQYWLADEVFVGGGAGLGILTNEPNSTFWFKPEIGFAFTARVGVSPWTSEDHRFGVSLEFVPGFYEYWRAMGLALNLEWQLF